MPGYNSILIIGSIFYFYLFCNHIFASSPNPLYVINITCPDGWVKAMNNCYYFNNRDQVTWLEARTECNILDADLMFIKNNEERDWMNIQTEDYVTDGWWVGLAYSFRNTWSWVQAGGNIGSINWRHEPDNYDEQDCCAINEFGLFSDEDCNKKLGFICKYSLNRGEYCNITSSRWLMSDTACFFISPLINTSLQLSWGDARDYCANLIPWKKPELLSIDTKDDMMTLKSLLQTFDTSGVLLPWWTGMNDLVAEGHYFWQNGSQVNMELIIFDNAPSLDRSRHRDCGVMYQGGAIDDMTCNKRAHYVCEKSAFSGYLNLGCGPWLRAGSSCYLISKGNRHTWSQARDMCSRANGHLIKIDSLDEKFWLQTLQLGADGFWTGLNTRAQKGSWLWVDGTTPNQSLIPWAQEPTDFQGNEDCAAIYRLGYYNDLKCDVKLGFICEYAKDDPGKSCISGWLSRGMSSCYLITPFSNTSSVTWDEAKDRCMDLVRSFGLVAYRLAVNDVEEQKWINAQLLKQPASVPWFWTGLNDRKSEGLWEYEEDFNNPPNKATINWPKEPNNLDGNEDCAAVYNGGLFNDVNCEYRIHFICERPLYGMQSNAAEKTPRRIILLCLFFFWCGTYVDKFLCFINNL